MGPAPGIGCKLWDTTLTPPPPPRRCRRNLPATMSYEITSSIIPYLQIILFNFVACFQITAPLQAPRMAKADLGQSNTFIPPRLLNSMASLKALKKAKADLGLLVHGCRYDHADSAILRQELFRCSIRGAAGLLFLKCQPFHADSAILK